MPDAESVGKHAFTRARGVLHFCSNRLHFEAAFLAFLPAPALREKAANRCGIRYRGAYGDGAKRSKSLRIARIPNYLGARSRRSNIFYF